MNKKGAEKTISVYWFAILVIVAGAIVYMVASVYGEPYDVRSLEADILSGKIADCINEGGYLVKGTLEDPGFKENFLKKCSLNLRTPDFSGDGEYYLETAVYDFASGGKIGTEIVYGNLNLRQYCGLGGKTIPACSNKSFYVVNNQQKGYSVNVIVVVNKADKNI